MRVLLDENVPHDLIPQLARHDVSTVQGLGWAGIRNGELLERARDAIDVFVTMDRKLEKQHDLSTLPFGAVVIYARSNRMPDFLPLTDALREAVRAHIDVNTPFVKRKAAEHENRQRILRCGGLRRSGPVYATSGAAWSWFHAPRTRSRSAWIWAMRLNWTC